MILSHYLEKSWSPDYDCWSLVQEFYQRELNIELPDVACNALNIREVLDEFELTDLYSLFRPALSPSHGCVVEMGTNGRSSHVGIYLEYSGGRILHNHYFGGVVCEPKPRHDILGYFT